MAKTGGNIIRLIKKSDSDYPQRFLQLPDPPTAIYQIGVLGPADDNAVAIIGSRDCTDVSAQRARAYARYFVQQGLCIVSGFATGVDLNAHIGALEADGRTIIIPGCGLDMLDLAPLQRLQISSFSELKKRAVLISEQPLGSNWSTPACLGRNRLVAAQAKAILVIEARLHSSTLNTVSWGEKLGRPIFAQSHGELSPRFRGNEMLRQRGCGVVRDEEDLSQIIALVKHI